jgi:hypothetical protein
MHSTKSIQKIDSQKHSVNYRRIETNFDYRRRIADKMLDAIPSECQESGTKD